MPITIQAPAGNQPPGTNVNPIFEVGQYLQASTDFIGPFSIDAFWTVQVWLSSVPERYVMLRKYPCTGPILKQYMWAVGIGNPAEDGEGFGVRPTTPGATASLRVMLDDPIASFHEETTIPGVMAQFDQALRVASNATSTVGFTDTDRELVTQTAAAVQVPLPISTLAGAVARTALGAFVQSAPLGLLSRQECRVITGRGSLTRPSPGFNVNALGCAWDFVAVPTYFGRKPGALLEFEQRIVQFKIVGRDFSGNDHVTQLIDATSDNQILTWGLQSPERIEYDVAPGCQVQFCWLLLLG